jgi:hypothetical protein
MSDPAPYQLHFVRDDGISDFEVELRSPLLDPLMHPDGSVLVEVSDNLAGPGVVLDPFQAASVEEYLRGQPGVRRALETALTNEMAMLRLPAAPSPGSVWGRSKVTFVWVGRKKVPTPENLVMHQQQFFPDESLEQIAAKFDRAETRSHFTVGLTVDWDEEHERWAQWRDGVLFEFSAV